MRMIGAWTLAAALAAGAALPAQESKSPGAIDTGGLKAGKKAAILPPKELAAQVSADIAKAQKAAMDRFIEAIVAQAKAPEAAEYATLATQFITDKAEADRLVKAVRENTELLKGEKPALGFIAAMLRYDPKFLENTMATNRSKDLAGLDKYLRAREAMEQFEEGEKPEDKKRALEFAAEVPAGLKAEIDGELQDLGQKAAGFKDQIARIEALGVGKAMPELAGKDLAGKAVKLADYRGKVVVVDVWATWCGPCRAMIPHERELVKRMKDKPFAFISISGDEEVGTLKKFLETEEMPWVHWHAGSEGEAMKTLNISHFPTIFVVDTKGVIRFKEVRGEELDKAVEKLVKEAAGEK